MEINNALSGVHTRSKKDDPVMKSRGNFGNNQIEIK